jgi:putative Holliday junction resolvase
MTDIDPAASVLAIDYGQKRLGLAIASMAAQLPQPLSVVYNDDNLITNLKVVVQQNNVGQIVVGYPRGLEGQLTTQTETVEAFVSQLKKQLPNTPIDTIDESLTSKQAEAELEGRGRSYAKEDIDNLAATIILEDWLSNHKQR